MAYTPLVLGSPTELTQHLGFAQLLFYFVSFIKRTIVKKTSLTSQQGVRYNSFSFSLPAYTRTSSCNTRPWSSDHHFACFEIANALWIKREEFEQAKWCDHNLICIRTGLKWRIPSWCPTPLHSCAPSATTVTPVSLSACFPPVPLRSFMLFFSLDKIIYCQFSELSYTPTLCCYSILFRRE